MTDPWLDLVALARLNHAVWKCRREVHSARAGVTCERRDASKTTRDRAAAAIAKACERETFALFALADAVAAWRDAAPPLRERIGEALRRRERFGATLPEVIAAMTARFGAVDAEEWPSKELRGDWTRRFRRSSLWSDSITFGASEWGGVDRVHVYCNGLRSRYVHADVGLPAETVRRIRSCDVYRGADMVPSPSWREEHDRDWSWGAALTAEEATDRYGVGVPLLSTVAVALDGVALLLADASAQAEASP